MEQRENPSLCGLKNTRQRLMILDLLERSDRPMTAEEIFLALKQEERRISLATIYRNLAALEQKEVLARTEYPNTNCSVYEIKREEHTHNLICIHCHRVIPIENCPFEAFGRAVSADTGFEIRGHKIEIYGICPACQK